MAGRSAPCTAQEPIRLFVSYKRTIVPALYILQVEARSRPFPIRALFVWQVKSLIRFTSKLVSCFAMSATSEESLRKDDNGGKSDSDGDIFDKISSLFGKAICEALQSKFLFKA